VDEEDEEDEEDKADSDCAPLSMRLGVALGELPDSC
jgi:hypothetical protein